MKNKPSKQSSESWEEKISYELREFANYFGYGMNKELSDEMMDKVISKLSNMFKSEIDKARNDERDLIASEIIQELKRLGKCCDFIPVWQSRIIDIIKNIKDKE
jgi:hypothetical protein